MSSANVELAWSALAGVADPELPTLSICDLGIVREVIDAARGVEVVLTPTYSGCPATEMIQADALAALAAAGIAPVRLTLRRAPAWTSDWISEQGLRKLREAGVAAPGACQTPAQAQAQVRFVPRRPACPLCASLDTELLSAFGSTACKSLHRCRVCREPFEQFKPI